MMLKKIHKKSLLVIIIAILILCLLNVTLAEETEYNIKLATTMEPGSAYVLALNTFAKHVNERTEGKVKVDIFPSSQLGNEQDVLQTLSQHGSIQMSIAGAWLSDYRPKPEFDITRAPFMFNSWEEARTVMREGDTMQKMFEAIRSDHNIRMLDPCWYFGQRQFTTNTEVRSVDDFQGLDIRSPDSKVYIAMMESLGINPTPIDFGEIYTALQMGVVDGQENPIPTIWDKKFFEVQKYLILTGHILQLNTVVINEEFFQSLPELYQQIIQEEIIAAGEYSTRMKLQQEQTYVSRLEEQGMEVIEIDKEEFRKAAQPVYELSDELWGEDIYISLMNELEKLRQ
jgi:TRAP-type transport system periplasmic protein